MLGLLVLAALPFIEDDYPRAAALAKQSGKPIVIDFWATWCHACLNMKSYVFTDPTVAALEKDAIFVSIDTEKETNLAIVQRFKPVGMPTFLIVDKDDKHVVGRLVASVTAPDFVAFVKNATPASLREADELATLGRSKEAMRRYKDALAEAPGRAAYGLAMLQMEAHDFAGCASTAATYAPQAKGTYFQPSLLLLHADCLLSDGKPADALSAPITDAIARGKLNVDDKSDMYAMLAAIAEARHDAAEVKRLRLLRRALLEDAAETAPTPEAARVFDAHRTDVYLELGEPDAAIAMLTASEKAAPQDYNPPARLARAYVVKGDLPNAKAAVARAMQRVYGPRAASLQVLEGDILLRSGERNGAKRAYTAARTLFAAQPQTEGVKRRLADLDKKLASL